MSSYVKKFLVSFFTLVVVFGLSQSLFVNANELEKTTVEAEDGSVIGIGKPKSTEPLSKKVQAENKVNGNAVTQTITIDTETSTTTLDVPLELEEGNYVVLGKSEQGEADGAALIYNAEGESIGVISAPVVENADEIEISSVKVENGDTLKFELETLELEGPTDIVVTAAATTYSSYFSSGTWITRDGAYPISLSMKHKSYLFSGTTNDRLMKIIDSWSKLKSKHSGHSKWKNAGGMEDQYNCHYNTIGSAKNPWNLEPARPNVSYAATVAAACNPK